MRDARSICRNLALCGLAVSLLGADSAPEVQFHDATQAVRLSFKHENAATTNKYLVETMGGGVALFDYDNDGRLDIFFTNGARIDDPMPDSKLPDKTDPKFWNRLYRQNADGTFSDVTEKAGLSGMPQNQYDMGVAVGDYDNDGFEDLYVTGFGHNTLYHNNGNGTFSDVTKKAGVPGGGWSASAGFVDYDNDGQLDLFVTRYVDWTFKTNRYCGEKRPGYRAYCHPDNYDGMSNILYHNNGDGTFTDVSDRAGIAKSVGKGLGVSFADYDGDGLTDIYVANDSVQCFLFHNNGTGTFTEVGLLAGVGYNEDGKTFAGMGIDFSDYDNDGHPDIFKTNFSDDRSSLYRNNGDGTFTSTIYDAGLGLNTRFLGWGTTFIDVDNDGRPDILAVNGHVYPEVDTAHLGSTYQEPRLFYWNAGNGKFKDLSQQCGPGCTRPESSRGLAIADLWNDGRISAAVNNMSSQPMLLVNQSHNQNHWLGVIIRGTKSNRDGIGAKVTVTAPGHRFVEDVRSGSSYISNNDMRLHFGLGASDRFERIEVRWPNGESEVFAGGSCDRFVTLTEGQGAPPGSAESVERE